MIAGFGYNIEIDILERMCITSIQFTLGHNLRDIFYKMMYCWCMTSEMYSGILNQCWKCGKHEETFYHAFWTCEKAKKFWKHIHIRMERILKVNIARMPELFLMGHMDNEVEKTQDRLILNIVLAGE